MDDRDGEDVFPGTWMWNVTKNVVPLSTWDSGRIVLQGISTSPLVILEARNGPAFRSADIHLPEMSEDQIV